MKTADAVPIYLAWKKHRARYARGSRYSPQVLSLVRLIQHRGFEFLLCLMAGESIAKIARDRGINSGYVCEQITRFANRLEIDMQNSREINADPAQAQRVLIRLKPL